MSRLERLLRPKAIAVVGGVEAERVVRQLDLLGFAGDIWPVHPTRTALADRPCVPSVSDLPDAPDAVFVAVPRHSVIPIIEALHRGDAGGVVVYSSGFAETGDIDLQDRLVEAAGSMPLIGPNCYGYVNALDGTAIWPDVHGLRPVERGVGIITQSGNIGINLTMARRGLDTGIILTAGNQAAVGIPELMDALLDDTRVTALGVQLESLIDSQGFGRAAIRAARQGVPIVALRMGSSDRGALVTASHTGAIAGDDNAYDALFARYGIARVRTIPTFLEALKLAGAVPPAPRVVSLSSSGGEASHVADLAEVAGVSFPEISHDQAASIAATLDTLVTISNPMDYHTFAWGDEAALAATFGAVIDGGFDVAMIVLDFPVDEVPESWWGACRAFAAAATGRLGLVVASLPENMPAPVQERIRQMGLVPMLGIAETIDALAALGRPTPAPMPQHAPGRSAPASTTTLDEASSKTLVAAAGIPVPRGVTATDPTSTTLPYPLTVKVLGLDHKAHAGAVAVGVPDAAHLASIVAGMPAGNGFLVEETVVGGVVELLLSLRAVEGIGWMITIGSGGSQVELIDDHEHLLVPASGDDVAAALLRTRMGTRLQASAAAIDLGAVTTAVVALQALSADEDIVEVEINPLIVTENGVVAVDAMVTTS